METSEIIRKLTLSEKAALLSGKNEWESRDIPRLGVHSIVFSDGPHGIRRQEGAGDHLGLNESLKATCFPTAATVANSWDEELAEEIGKALGEEAVYQKVDVLLGPGLNMKRSPLCGRNFEYFSEDPVLAGKMAAAYIRGIQSNHIYACPKHFAVNSREYRRMAMNAVVDERTFREIYLTAFEIAVKEGAAKCIMSAYNEVNGQYANENEHLLVDILRKEWQFDGMVVTDWGASNDHVQGTKCQSNVEMPNPGFDSAREILKAVDEGILTEKEIDRAITPLLEAAAFVKNNDHTKAFDIEAHHRIARKAAGQSVVLLKNDEGVLPLKAGMKVALRGPFVEKPRYQGAGSSQVNATRVETISAEIKNYELSVVSEVEAADVVLYFFGLDEIAESEGADRLSMDIPKYQIKEIEQLSSQKSNIVGIMSAGSAVTMPWIGKMKALLHGYLGGQAGASAVLDIVTGKVNPSGKLSETYPFTYEDCSICNYADEEKRNMEYREGPFIGYRYYDTVHKPVQFPFGYGLSYTTFEQSIISFEAADDTVSVDVNVTNTGDMAGKDIVQIYLTAPYYAGGIEKSHVELVGFDKTDELTPGASETIHIEMNIEDFASYDYINEKAYVLDQGIYEIKLMDNAHDLIEAREFEIEETVVFDESSPRSTDEVAATNLFDDVAGDIVYLSRADWEGTMPVDVPRTKEVSEEIIDAIHSTDYEVDDGDEDVIVADHGITFAEMKDVDYDDPKWDEFLEQLSVEEMSQLIGLGGYQTMPVKSIDKGITSDVDGPAGINAIVNGQSGITHATEVVLASTFNVELAAEMGNSLASQADAYSIDGIYAPAMNIHRSPFSGRNFEYYSEDPYLSGIMGATEIRAIRDAGKYCYVKHFALNDQETNRNGVSTWSNEQAMREIYLKPFEYAVKEGDATAMMSAFVRLGPVWCGANYDLLTNVLRNEWGFHGMVITDYDGASYMNVDQAIRAGNDMMLSTLGDEPRDKSNTGKQAMRNASHNILYTVVNSNASTYTYKYIFPTWKIFLFGFDAIVVILIVVSIIVKRKKKASEV